MKKHLLRIAVVLCALVVVAVGSWWAWPDSKVPAKRTQMHHLLNELAMAARLYKEDHKFYPWEKLTYDSASATTSSADIIRMLAPDDDRLTKGRKPPATTKRSSFPALAY